MWLDEELKAFAVDYKKYPCRFTAGSEYKGGSASEKTRERDSFYLENSKQVETVLTYIRKYCPELDV